MTNSITIKNALQRITGLSLSVGTTLGKDPFIIVRTADRSFFPTALRAACIRRVYPGWRGDECPASYGNIECHSIGIKAREWADVISLFECPEFRMVLAIEECLAAQRAACFARCVEEMIFPV